MRKRLSYLNAFFVSVFKRMTSYTHDNQSSELVHRDREQHRPPVTHERVVCDMLCLLDTQRSMGLDGIHHPGEITLCDT